jgi:hypothetical protein
MQLLAVGPSAMFTCLKWAAAGVTAVAATWLAVSGHGVAAGAAGVAALAACHVRQAGWQLRLRTDGICETGGVETVVTGVFSGAGWMVLRLAGRRRRDARVLVLAPDAATAEELRQLRVWLRWSAPRGDLNSRGAAWS